LVLSGWPWGPRVNKHMFKGDSVAPPNESGAIEDEDMFHDVDLPSLGHLGPGSAVHLLSGRFLLGGVPWCKGTPFRKPLIEVSWQGSAYSILCAACLNRDRLGQSGRSRLICRLRVVSRGRQPVRPHWVQMGTLRNSPVFNGEPFPLSCNGRSYRHGGFAKCPLCRKTI